MTDSLVPMIPNFKKKKNNLLRQVLLISLGIFILSALIFLTIADIRIYQKREKFISQIEKSKSKIEDLKNKNNDLKKGISAIDDNTYIEKIAREELSLQKPGEKVFSFIKESNQLEDNNQGKKNFLQIWLGWVGNAWSWIKVRF